MTSPEGIVLVEWFNEHWYKVTKDAITTFIPSVTTKLGIIDKPFLAQWRGDIGNREADFRMYEAGQRGKRIHWAYEMALQGGVVIYDPWQTPVYTPEGIQELKAKYKDQIAILRTQDEMVQMWKLQRQFEALHPFVVTVEETVYDLENKDAGTIDNVLWIDEGDYQVNGDKPIHLESGLYINDLKTGKVIDNNTWLQLSAYGFMYEKSHGMKIKGALITHTSGKAKKGIAGLATLFRDRETLLERDYMDYRHASALWERNHRDDQPDQFQFPSLVQFTLKEPHK